MSIIGTREFLFFVYFFLGTFLLTSCYEQEESCLDPLSTNFNISADIACEECCTYPNVKLSVKHFLGDAVYSSDSTIVNDFGQEFKLDQLVLFLSDFRFYTLDDNALQVNKTALFENSASEEFQIKDDAIVLKKSSTVSTIGMVRETGIIDSLVCTLGVSHNLVPLETSSSLYNYDSLYVDDSYYDLVLYLKVGDSLTDDISLRFSTTNDNFLVRDTVINIDKQARSDINFTMSLDYLELLKSIELDLDQESQEVINYVTPANFIKFTR